MTDMNGRRIDQLGTNLIVYGGVCTSCSLHQVDFHKLPFERFDEVILFFQSPQDEIPRALRSYSKNIRIISDEQGSLAKKLNATWLGKSCVSSKGRLSYIQKEESDRTFLQAAMGK